MAPRPKAVAKEPVGEQKLYALVDQLEENRQKRRPIEAQLAPLEDEMKDIKNKIMETMDELGETKARTTHATVSISEIERVVCDDMGKAVASLKKDGWLHILEFKVVQAREYMEKKGKPIPGTHLEVVRRQLNHTSVK